MPDFDKNSGAFGFGEGTVMTQVRTTNPSASTIGTVLVAEDAFQYEDLFPSDMRVGIETGMGRPTDQGGMFGESLMQ
jgi:hypothetical protein